MTKSMRAVSAAAVCALSMTLLPACSADNTAPVLTYRDTAVTEAMYTYWMSSYKTYFLNSYLGVSDTSAALDTEITVKDGSLDVTKKISDVLTERITDIIDNNLISLYLFDSYDLSLPKDVLQTIDMMITSEIENAGSRKELNEALAPLGLNVNILKELYTAEEKISYLYEYLYGNTEMGTNGAEPISVERYQQFYEENYACVKHIYIRTYDKNVVDENGEAVYNTDGSIMMAELTKEETEERMALIDDLMARLNAGEDFDALMMEYSMDANRELFPEGYIVCASTAMPAEFIDAALDMEIGELRRVDASYATHIMLRTELPEGGWRQDKYRGMMSDFTEHLKSEVYAEKIAPMIKDIERDKSLVDKLNIYDVPTTLY